MEKLIAIIIVIATMLATEIKSQPIKMVLVEGGTFTTETKEIVTVSSFYMAKFEVFQKIYKEVMGYNPSEFKGDNLPVEKVTWYDAIEFCNAMSQREGLTPVYTISVDNIQADWSANGYRLPTEAEWEYAARGGKGSKGYKYSGSNEVDEVGWYKSNSGKKTNPVGRKIANELGIYDMSGNVWEWCWDSRRTISESKTDPRGADSERFRMRRGGSWTSDAVFIRPANRNSFSPSSSSSTLGFRVVRTAK